MTPTRRGGIAVLCLGIAVLAGVASGAGVFLRGDGSFEMVVSVRGESYPMATAGVYAYNALRVVAEGVGWDLVTLLFAVPALLAVVPALARDSVPARLFAVGILGYVFYQYLMYAVTWALGPLFPLFIVIYASSLVAIAWIVATIPVADLPLRFSDSFPRRGMAILSFALAALLVIMWSGRIIGALRGEVEGVLLGQTTLVVQALDLGLVVPLALFTGVTAWRGSAIGYLLASTVVVKAFAMAAAICGMLLTAWVVEGALEAVPLAIFATIAGLTVWLALRMYLSYRPDPGVSGAAEPSRHP